MKAFGWSYLFVAEKSETQARAICQVIIKLVLFLVFSKK